ncbi:DEAD/DEAH box helicase [Acidisoma cellulosilytica]|uniref:DEAD/DEAH box helicase n=1 Tax=Acidisoma cellulosilyticum TaxID=2802395 RepID=A0A963Z1N9_9PROT|nr:DEAD/DEAH box helicase [Acidisoma cellulosilyticum]MCB8880235.1 DEAD/DEAH box helicase [Acidisoma cellulosilyticum]
MPFPTPHAALAQALEARGYSEPTSVQAAILAAEPGRDLLVSAQTGSGKTVAYGLAFAETLFAGAEHLPQAGAPLALIIAPTRELAQQVHAELTWLYAEARARIVSCVGGMDARTEARALARGAHIVVGTPGRLKDHLERRQLDSSQLRVVVLDEADEMLDLGFREELEFILDAAPAERRTLLFSATIAREIANMARRFQKDALRIDTVDRSQPHADIEYRAMKIDPSLVEAATVNTLRLIDSPAIIFCARRDGVRTMTDALNARGFNAVALSGELSQQERNNALQAVRDGRARVCVATDVAARGLDLPELGLVIHADLPTNKETLLHRSGRTGRAGRKGICVLMVAHSRRRRAEMLINTAGITARWSTAPSAAEIREQDQQRLLNDAIISEPTAEDDAALAYQMAERYGAEAMAAAFIRVRRQSLPAPADIEGARPGFEEARPGFRERDREKAPRDYSERRERNFDRAPDQGGEGPRANFYENAGEPMVWFRTSVGRSKKADPKWLLPLICRLGTVTKKDVGAIRITDHETRFQISAAASEAFMASVGEAGDNEIRIEHADGPPAAESPRPRGDFNRSSRPPRRDGDRPSGDRPDYAARKPSFGKGPGAGGGYNRSVRTRAKG